MSGRGIFSGLDRDLAAGRRRSLQRRSNRILHARDFFIGDFEEAVLHSLTALRLLKTTAKQRDLEVTGWVKCRQADGVEPYW